MGGLVAIPLILSNGLCLQHDLLTQSHLISTIFFVSGICTLLQVLFGVRYARTGNVSNYCVPGHHPVGKFISLLPLGNQGPCQSTLKLLRALQGYLAVLNFASPDTSHTFC